MTKKRRETIEAGFPASLKDGYKAFVFSRLRHERERYETLAENGQEPRVMVISCCDSRAAPEMIFDAMPGEFFVVRNVANQVPPYKPDDDYHGTSAALEYAVQQLRVSHILVMGHGRCGGVTAFREQMEGVENKPLSPGDFIGRWINLIEPAAKDIRCDDPADTAKRQRALEEANIRNAIKNLKTFPCVSILLERNQLRLHGAWFDISGGDLWIMDEDSGDFSVCEI